MYRRTSADEGIIEDWRAFYAALNYKLDPSGLVIPRESVYFSRVLVIAEMKLEEIWEASQSSFGTYVYPKNLFDFEKNPRLFSGAYAIRVCNQVEPDRTLEKLSAIDLEENGIITESLRERLIHGLKYHQETGDHLDRQTATLCAGSRLGEISPWRRVGFVPSVTYAELRGSVCVFEEHPGQRMSLVRARECKFD